MNQIFLNDKLIDNDAAGITVSDSGLLYGTGLFETMRACNGIVFSLADHLDRLFTSAEKLSINIDCDRQYIADAVEQVLKANNLTEARLRITLTGGTLSGSDQPKPTLLITATEFTPYPAEYYRKGVMTVLSRYRQNPSDPTTGHKTTSYFSRMLALKEAHQKHAAEALWFTTDNRLAEGCVSNVFLVKDSILYTPGLNTPVLPGIARKTVCRLAVKNSIELVEKDLSIDDILAADEIFLTNVIMQVMPVVQLEKHVVGSGRVGEVTSRLYEAFNKYIEDICKIKQ